MYGDRQDRQNPNAVADLAGGDLVRCRGSALGLKRVLGLGSYQTAWAMLHRLPPRT